MAVYVECPKCHRKQALKNDSCRKCDNDLQRERRSNSAAYWVYLRFRGEQVWERIGPSLTVARGQETLIKARLVKSEYEPAGQATKLKPFFEKHFLPWAKREKKSWDKDESRFNNHVLPFFKNVKLASIQVTRVEAFKKHRLGQGAKNSTVNRDLALLKTIYNKAVKWGAYNRQNPVMLAGMLDENNMHVARALTEEEVDRLLPEIPGETRPIIEFCLATGIRIGNVMDLKWDQIDLAHRIIHLPKTKSGKALVIPLNDWAFEIIRSAPHHIRSPYVFCKLNGKPYKTLRRGFKSALKRASLDTSIRIHDLRHTYATWAAARGVPTSALKDLLGHSSLAMVSRYSHLGHQSLLNMSNRVTRPTPPENQSKKA